MTTNSREPTYRILAREGGSWSLYYTLPGNQTHYIVMDSLDGNFRYLDAINWWRARNLYSHGFAIKTDGKTLAVVRFLLHRAWLFVLVLPDDAGSNNPYKLVVSTVDGATEFDARYLENYHFAIQCLSEIAAMTDYPAQLQDAGYLIIDPLVPEK